MTERELSKAIRSGDVMQRQGRLAVLLETHFHKTDDALFAPNDTFYRFVEAFDPYFETITLCSPVIERISDDDAELGYRVRYPFEFVRTEPFKSWLGYMKRLPRIVLKNYGIYRRAFAEAELVWLRLPSPNALLAFIAAKRSNVPTFIYLAANLRRSLEDRLDQYNFVERLAIRVLLAYIEASTAFMARRTPTFVLGDELEQQYRQRLDSRSGKIHKAVPSLIAPEDIFRERSDTCIDAPIRLLYVGRITPEKRIPYIIDALRELLRDGYDVRLDLVGTGSEENKIHVKIESDPQLRERVFIHGQVTKFDALLQIYRSADIFVLASVSEGVPKVLIEAMSQGLPIVATDVGGVSDVVVHRKTGLLVPAGSPDKILCSVKEIIEDDDLRKLLIQNSLIAAESYTAPRQARDIMQKLVDSYPQLASLLKE